MTATRPGCGVDAAVWTVADASTRRLAAQTTEALSTRQWAATIADRYGRHDVGQRAGHLFELWHKHTFNLDAIRRGADVRAEVTAACGQPTAAADLRLVERGRVVDEIQAKLYGRATATARALARPKYDDMQRLVARDKREHVENLLDKALHRDENGLYQADYADTRAHLTDTVTHGEVNSTPVTYEQAQRAAANPRRWGDQRVAGVAARQVGGAALAGAVVGGGIAAVTAAVRETARVRAGETTAAAAACTAAGSAALSAARSGALAGLGATAKIAMTAAGAPGSILGGGLPGAVASAVVAVAEAGIGLARGELDVAEFAALSCESTFSAGMAWAGGAVGQTVLPVPVVGALVGGFVGQLSATLIVQGLELAIEAVRTDDVDDDRVVLLETEAEAARESAVLLADAGEALGREHDALVGTEIVPLLDDVLRSTLTNGVGSGLSELAHLAQDLDGRPLFVNVEEFDAWMADPFTTLSLSTNW